MTKTITDLLKILKIPASSSYVEHLISVHADYPTLLSVVDTLNRLGIPNTAAKIEPEQLVDLQFPYVLQLGTKRGDFLLIKNPKDIEDNKDRLQRWEGIVLHVEHTKKINIDADHHEALKREGFSKLLMYVCVAALLIPFAVFLVSTFSIQTFAIAIPALAGLVLGYVLVAKDIGIKFDAVEDFCTTDDSSNACNYVIESDAAKLFGVFKLSDMVLSYFLTQIFCLALLLFIPAWHASVIQVFSVASGLSLFMVAYSIVYQYQLKAWCKLCLIVDGILLIQAAIFIALFDQSFIAPFQPGAVAAILLSALIIASLVMLFKGKAEALIEMQKVAIDGWRVKNSPKIFRRLISTEEVELQCNSDQRLIVGNKNAPLRFLMISNLNCRPCSIQHKKIEQLVEMYPDKVAFEFRPIATKDSDEVPNSRQYIIEYWMRNYRGRDNESELLRKMLLDWYQDRDPKIFRKKYPMKDPTPSKECLDMEAAHVDWARRQVIIGTPAFFLNGRRLPGQYQPLDLATMIPALAPPPGARVSDTKVVLKEDIESLV